MGRNFAETVMGAVVLLVAAGFLYIFATTARVTAVEGYDVTAIFTDTGGLQAGNDVRISGITVGSVKSNNLDAETFEAVVTLSINPDVKVPKDTVAAITSAGLIGGNYVRLKPGASKEFLKGGGVIEKSEDFQSLERQVGEIIFLATGGNDNKSN
ncbi:MAG: MlaD family protein [Pseudomonadota bacterium]|nr:MlaD family protein [Pseudomonadota bacterium]